MAALKRGTAPDVPWQRVINAKGRISVHGDDCVFIPGEDNNVRIDEMEKFIYRDLSIPTIDNALKDKIIRQRSVDEQYSIQQNRENSIQNKPVQPQNNWRMVINKCPVCGSTNVSPPRRNNMSCIWITFIFISWGIGLIVWFLTPKYVTCNNCGAKWKA